MAPAPTVTRLGVAQCTGGNISPRPAARLRDFLRPWRNQHCRAGWVYTSRDLAASEFENAETFLKLLNAMGADDGRGELVMVSDLPDARERLHFKKPP